MREQKQTQRRWQQRITAQQSSGMSITEFCRRERINKGTFYWWKRRVQAAPAHSFVELKVAPEARRNKQTVLSFREPPPSAESIFLERSL